MEGRSSTGGVRKGAWSREEDILLKKCIDKYGEGKWHLVPSRAGLNRCRKSCRLRWMNHLKPEIKRGEFTVDEIDLVLRLHKLLGNRWALIAGRIPGRTANDVKNYWNTHLRKKLVSSHDKKNKIAENSINDNTSSTPKSNIIIPRPRTFKKQPSLINSNNSTIATNINIPPTHKNNREAAAAELPVQEEEEMAKSWWECLLDDHCTTSEDGIINSVCNTGFPDHDERNNLTNFLSPELAEPTGLVGSPADKRVLDGSWGAVLFDEEHGHQNFWKDLLVDMDLWDLDQGKK